jgi:hypothetical protein
MAELEGRLGDQEERLAAQQAEIAWLRAELAEERAGPARSTLPPARPLGRATGGPNRSNGHRASRRALLRLGGAAAAAGMAAGAVQLWRPASARAAGAHALTATEEKSASGSGNVALQGDGTSDAAGVAGTTDTNYGVHGTASSSGSGVFAESVSGTGMYAQSHSGAGAQAISTTWDGFFAQGAHYGASLLGSTAPLFLWPQGFTGYPTSGIHNAGEVLFDNTGNLWLCVLAGTPGRWRKVSTVHFGFTGGAVNFLPTPIRLLDTRAGAAVGNLLPGAPVAYHGTINVPAAGVTYQMQTIPPDAVGVFGLLTAALDTASAFNCGDGSSAICWATGTPRPAAVNVVFNPQDLKGAYTANFTMVQCGTGGDISIYSQPINIMPTPQVAVDYLFDCFGFVV